MLLQVCCVLYFTIIFINGQSTLGLRQVCLVYNVDHCKRNFIRVRREVLMTTEVAGGREAKPREHKAMGDSGGPLVIKVPGNCLKTQIGITYFGRECGLPNTPGVYTKVAHFVPWIESIVWPNNS